MRPARFMTTFLAATAATIGTSGAAVAQTPSVDLETLAKNLVVGKAAAEQAGALRVDSTFMYQPTGVTTRRVPYIKVVPPIKAKKVNQVSAKVVETNASGAQGTPYAGLPCTVVLLRPEDIMSGSPLEIRNARKQWQDGVKVTFCTTPDGQAKAFTEFKPEQRSGYEAAKSRWEKMRERFRRTPEQ